MKLAAINKSEVRLRKAADALERAENSKSYEEFESAWSDFLIYCSAIFNILEAGTKGNNKSASWFGQKKGERKKDPLLQYLHHARGAEEHGIEPVVSHEPGKLILGRGLKGGMALQGVSMEGNTIKIKAALTDMSEADKIVSLQAPHPKLVPIEDTRHGNTYQIPKKHLGNDLDNTMPLIVARLGLAYMEQMVAEAKNIADGEQ